MSRHFWKWLVISPIVFVGVWMAWQIFSVGLVRQARFNTDVLGKVIEEYHKVKGRYPTQIKDLPRFVVVSVRDRLSCEDVHFKKTGIWHGYSYDLRSIDENHFLLLAQPVGWPRSKTSFGLTEDGKLRFHMSLNSSVTPAYEEVKQWMVTERLNRISAQ